jgi:hypothetical protein
MGNNVPLFKMGPARGSNNGNSKVKFMSTLCKSGVCGYNRQNAISRYK